MNLLRALAEQDCDLQAPGHLEARVVAAFRARRNRRRFVRLGTGVAAASMVAALGLWITPKAVVWPEIRVAPPSAPAVEARRKPVETRQAVTPVRREVVTDFFPLLDAPPPFERGEILRVEVPASAMRSVGLPVREERLQDRVQADVLVGEEGLPRAIRFVSFDSN